MNYIISSANGVNLPPVLNPSSSSYYLQIVPVLTNVSTAKLKHVILPNTVYNVRSNNCNFIIREAGSTAITISIPYGYYNVSTMCIMLQQLLSSVGTQTYAVTYSSTTFLLTISAPGAFLLDFGGLQSCAALLGFLPIATTSDVLHTGTNAMHLQIDVLYIVIDEFSRGIIGKNGKPYTFMIPLDENSGSIINYNNKSTFTQVVQVNSVPLYELHVKLLLPNDELVDLNGSEWSMLLEFT
jgi:hypothetical protein